MARAWMTGSSITRPAAESEPPDDEVDGHAPGSGAAAAPSPRSGASRPVHCFENRPRKKKKSGGLVHDLPRPLVAWMPRPGGGREGRLHRVVHVVYHQVPRGLRASTGSCPRLACFHRRAFTTRATPPGFTVVEASRRSPGTSPAAVSGGVRVGGGYGHCCGPGAAGPARWLRGPHLPAPSTTLLCHRVESKPSSRTRLWCCIFESLAVTFENRPMRPSGER